jgi:hypothetical protein
MVPCLFFSFAELFDFGWCFLAQEMSLVVSYLPYFRQQVITLQLSAFLSFQHLFTEVHMEISSLLLPLSLVCFQSFHPLCCIFSLLYIIQICLFVCFLWRISLPRGLCWFIPGVAGETLHDAWHSPVGLAKCLLSRFGALSSGIGGGGGSPTCFLSAGGVEKLSTG